MFKIVYNIAYYKLIIILFNKWFNKYRYLLEIITEQIVSDQFSWQEKLNLKTNKQNKAASIWEAKTPEKKEM